MLSLLKCAKHSTESICFFQIDTIIDIDSSQQGSVEIVPQCRRCRGQETMSTPSIVIIDQLEDSNQAVYSSNATGLPASIVYQLLINCAKMNPSRLFQPFLKHITSLMDPKFHKCYSDSSGIESACSLAGRIIRFFKFMQSDLMNIMDEASHLLEWDLLIPSQVYESTALGLPLETVPRSIFNTNRQSSPSLHGLNKLKRSLLDLMQRFVSILVAGPLQRDIEAYLDLGIKPIWKQNQNTKAVNNEGDDAVNVGVFASPQYLRALSSVNIIPSLLVFFEGEVEYRIRLLRVFERVCWLLRDDFTSQPIRYRNQLPELAQECLCHLVSSLFQSVKIRGNGRQSAWRQSQHFIFSYTMNLALRRDIIPSQTELQTQFNNSFLSDSSYQQQPSLNKLYIQQVNQIDNGIEQVPLHTQNIEQGLQRLQLVVPKWLTVQSEFPLQSGQETSLIIQGLVDNCAARITIGLCDLQRSNYFDKDILLISGDVVHTSIGTVGGQNMADVSRPLLQCRNFKCPTKCPCEFYTGESRILIRLLKRRNELLARYRRRIICRMKVNEDLQSYLWFLKVSLIGQTSVRLIR